MVNIGTGEGLFFKKKKRTAIFEILKALNKGKKKTGNAIQAL